MTTGDDTDDDAQDEPINQPIRDPETGRIIGNAGTPAELSERGRALRARYEKKTAQQLEAEAEALLRQMGYDDPAQADPSDRVLSKKAAKGDVRALTLLLSQSGQLVRAARQGKGATPGQWTGSGTCPTCGAVHGVLELSPSTCIGAGLALQEHGQLMLAAGKNEKTPFRYTSIIPPLPRTD